MIVVGVDLEGAAAFRPGCTARQAGRRDGALQTEQSGAPGEPGRVDRGPR